MKIYVPFTTIQPLTKKVLEPYEYIPIKMVEDDDYPKYFQKRWEEGLKGHSFVNVEHDTIFWPGAIEDLINCPHTWCAFHLKGKDATWVQGEGSYSSGWVDKHFSDGFGGIATLALMKFDHRFIERYPDMWNDYLALDNWKNQPKWLGCDTWLHHYVNHCTKDIGLKEICHEHTPAIINANPQYPLPPIDKIYKGIF